MDSHRLPPLASSLLEAIPAAACLLDSQDLRVVAHNRSYRLLLAEPHRTSGVVGLRIDEYVTNIEDGDVLERHRRVTRTGEAFAVHCLRGRGDDGELKYWDEYIVPVTDARGRVIWQLVTFTEVSDHVRAQQRLEAALARERLLSDASRAFAEAENFDIALERVVDLCVTNFADACGILLQEHGQLKVAALRHWDPATEKRIREALNSHPPLVEQSSFLQVLLAGEPLLQNEPRLEDFTPQFRPFVARLDIGPLLGVALRTKQETFGALVLGRKKRAAPFTEQDLVFATAIADRAALSLSSLRLRDRLRQTNERLAKTVTQARAAEQEAVRQLEFNRALTSSLGEGVFAIDREGRIIFVNPAAEKLLGWTASELVGKDLHQVVHLHGVEGSSYPAEACPMMLTLASGEAQRIADDVFTLRDGTSLPVSYVVAPVLVDRRVVSAVVAFHDIAGRKRAEQQLQQRIEQLQQIYQLTDVVGRATELDDIYATALHSLQRTLRIDRGAVLLFDADGVMRFKAWLRLSDAYRKAVEGHTPWAQSARDPRPVLVSNVETEPSLRNLRSAILGEGIHALAFIPLIHQGQLLGKFMLYYDAPHQFTTDEVRLAQTIAGHVAFGIARRRSEEALRASEERYRYIIETAQEGIWIVDAEDRTTFVNDRMAEMLGYTVDEMIGQPIYAFMDEESREIAKAGMESRRRGFKGEADFRFRRKDGSPLWALVSATPYFDESGRFLGSLGMVTDITKRKQAEAERERLLERERVLSNIGRALVSELELERVTDAVIVQSLRVLGADAVEIHLADAARRQLVLLAHRNLAPSTVEALQAVSYDAPLLSARAARTEEPQVVEALRDVELAPLARKIYQQEAAESVLAVPLRSRGRLVGVATYLFRTPRRFSTADLEFNLTVADLFAVAIENAHLYDELRQALRLREEFMAAAAHELKTPVTTIKGWTELLLKNDGTQRERKALETIGRQSDRITRLIDELLAVIRLHPGLASAPLKREQFDLGTLAQEVVDRIARTTEGYQFRYTSRGRLEVVADRQLIGEALGYLLENAMRYSPAGGPIEVKARREHNEAVVAVRDYGVGIPFERQRHVFEPFFEVVPSGVPGYAGIVSLGLHVCKQIIDAHGGRVWFTSVPGKGSTFYFSLPLASV